jgi:hypothetical protein
MEMLKSLRIVLHSVQLVVWITRPSLLEKGRDGENVIREEWFVIGTIQFTQMKSFASPGGFVLKGWVRRVSDQGAQSFIVRKMCGAIKLLDKAPSSKAPPKIVSSHSEGQNVSFWARRADLHVKIGL